MQFEGAPERARPYIDPEVWAAMQPLDPTNDLHLDQLAEGLLAAFQEHDDAEAYKSLVDLISPRLEEIADDITDEVAVILNPGSLVSTLMGRLFITTQRPMARTKRFLAWASERMTAEAEAWVRDYAMADVTPADRADGEQGPQPNTVSQGYQNIVHICFHRLDDRLRRILFAYDVRGLSLAEVASRYDLTSDEAAAEVHEAKHRLDELVQAAQGGSA